MKYKVEGLGYNDETLAVIVAARFALRYGRDIAVCNAKDKVLYYVTAKGKRVPVK